jgi:hypothetical protein
MMVLVEADKSDNTLSSRKEMFNAQEGVKLASIEVPVAAGYGSHLFIRVVSKVVVDLRFWRQPYYITVAY